MALPVAPLLSHQHVLIAGADASAHPLVLLHGSGGGERELLAFVASVDASAPAIGIRGAEPWEDGFAFFRRFADRSIDEANLLENSRSLAGFIAAACASHGFTQKPVAIGFSNGAIMAASLVLTQPDLLAGALLLRPLSPFAQDPPCALNGVPVLIIDGAHDTRRSPGDGHRLAARLTNAGASVEHHILPTGHAISPEDRALAAAWMRRFR